jgi:hypothetical protein
LDDPQQFRLKGEREITDLIQEQRSAVGGFERAGFGHDRAGEGASLMTEEFAFHQCFSDRSAVDRNERACPTSTQLM